MTSHITNWISWSRNQLYYADSGWAQLLLIWNSWASVWTSLYSHSERFLWTKLQVCAHYPSLDFSLVKWNVAVFIWVAWIWNWLTVREIMAFVKSVRLPLHCVPRQTCQQIHGGLLQVSSLDTWTDTTLWSGGNKCSQTLGENKTFWGNNQKVHKITHSYSWGCFVVWRTVSSEKPKPKCIFPSKARGASVPPAFPHFTSVQTQNTGQSVKRQISLALCTTKLGLGVFKSFVVLAQDKRRLYSRSRRQKTRETFHLKELIKHFFWSIVTNCRNISIKSDIASRALRWKAFQVSSSNPVFLSLLS